MRVYTNERRYRRRKLRQFVGILLNTALLLMGLFAILLIATYLISPSLAGSPVLLVAIGLLSTYIGLQAGNQLSDLPVPHETLNHALKGISTDSAIYHYYLPADHVLITPDGVFTLTVRGQRAHIKFEDNNIHVEDSTWQRFMRFISQQSIGEPVEDAVSDAEKAELWFEDNLPGENANFQPVLVFLNEEAEVEVTGMPEVPIVFADRRKLSVKAYVKSHPGAASTVTPEDVDSINAVLDIPR